MSSVFALPEHQVTALSRRGVLAAVRAQAVTIGKVVGASGVRWRTAVCSVLALVPLQSLGSMFLDTTEVLGLDEARALGFEVLASRNLDEFAFIHLAPPEQSDQGCKLTYIGQRVTDLEGNELTRTASEVTGTPPEVVSHIVKPSILISRVSFTYRCEHMQQTYEIVLAEMTGEDVAAP